MGKLKGIRIAKGMTQEELADKAGIARTYIAKLENSPQVVLKTTTLEKLAAALGVELKELLPLNED